jgi:hypothetical protein
MNPGTCIHFTGIQHDFCKLSYEYKKLDSPLPCIRSYKRQFPKEQRGQQEPTAHSDCIGYQAPTPEQIAEDELHIKEVMARMDLIMAAVRPFRDANKGKSARGLIECPVCKGKLHLQIAACNGHVWGKCETEGCMSWME